MYVIIPMTGYGSRFVAAGYQELKPFIPIMKMPIIEWIVTRMYPADTDFIFVCRGEHLTEDSTMRERLMTLRRRQNLWLLRIGLRKARSMMCFGRTEN